MTEITALSLFQGNPQLMNGKGSSNGLFSLNPWDYLLNIINYRSHFLVFLYVSKYNSSSDLFITNIINVGRFSKQLNFVTKKSVVINGVVLMSCINLT